MSARVVAGGHDVTQQMPRTAARLEAMRPRDGVVGLVTKWKVNQNVYHRSFGYGTITAVDAPRGFLIVRFWDERIELRAMHYLNRGLMKAWQQNKGYAQ